MQNKKASSSLKSRGHVQTASDYLKEHPNVATPKDSLLDEIESRLDHNWKVGLMIGDKDSTVMNEREKQRFREKEYSDYELMEQSK